MSASTDAVVAWWPCWSRWWWTAPRGGTSGGSNEAGDSSGLLDAIDQRRALTAGREALGLPDLDGTDVIKGVRDHGTVPIIVLSARTDSTDKVHALDAGADDYVTKPFGMDELLARLRAYFAQLRRKLEPEPSRPRHLITEPGMGYWLVR